jgi:hypothetical protein
MARRLLAGAVAASLALSAHGFAASFAVAPAEVIRSRPTGMLALTCGVTDGPGVRYRLFPQKRDRGVVDVVATLSENGMDFAESFPPPSVCHDAVCLQVMHYVWCSAYEGRGPRQGARDLWGGAWDLWQAGRVPWLLRQQQRRRGNPWIPREGRLPSRFRLWTR